MTLKVVLTVLCVNDSGPALQEYHNEFGITQKINGRRLGRNGKVINNVPVQKTNVFVLM